MKTTPAFTDLIQSDLLLRRLEELNYHSPTPIQQMAIPLILAGRDVAGQAETGSGKTAAYGLPILQTLQSGISQVQGLIIVPTRELAIQVRDELKKLGKHTAQLKITAVYGGHSFSEEKNSLAHPPQILIATPGRLLDHLQRGTLQVDHIRYVVFDEADKLLEMNFEEEMQEIIKVLPLKRQSLLFSATLSEPVKELIRRSLSNPEFLQAEKKANPLQIEQIAIRTEPEQKLATLVQLLSQIKDNRAIIFCNTRDYIEEVVHFLRQKGFSATGLHGAMDQMDRNKAFTKFRNGSVQLLVATDLAARGIDIAQLDTIIHLEILRDEASFLHRSGRTGRAGNSGKVYTLLSKEEEQYMQRWQQVHISQWQEMDRQPASKSRRALTPSLPQNITLHLNAGKKEKMSAKDIVGALIAEAGLGADQIGKIEIHDHFSYVAVPQNEGKRIADQLSQGKIKGKKIRVTVAK